MTSFGKQLSIKMFGTTSGKSGPPSDKPPTLRSQGSHIFSRSKEPLRGSQDESGLESIKGPENQKGVSFWINKLELAFKDKKKLPSNIFLEVKGVLQSFTISMQLKESPDSEAHIFVPTEDFGDSFIFPNSNLKFLLRLFYEDVKRKEVPICEGFIENTAAKAAKTKDTFCELKGKKENAVLHYRLSVFSSSLFEHVKNGDLSKFSELIKGPEAFINGYDNLRWTLLHQACYLLRSDSSFLDLILEHPEIDVSVQNSDGNTPLHYLIQGTLNEGHYKTLLIKFVDLGCKIDAKNKHGETVIHRALSRRTEHTDKFIRAILDTFSRSRTPEEVKSFLNTRSNDSGSTVLHYAAKIDGVEIFKSLIGCGADPAIKDKEGMSPLEIAGESQDRRMKVFVQRKGWKLNTTLTRSDVVGLQATDDWIIDENDLTFEKVIATGTSGEVWRGDFKGNSVAIKVLKGGKKDSVHYEKAEVEEFAKEAKLNTLVHSPYIVRFFGVSLNPLYLVMEFCDNGSLYDCMKKNPQNVGWCEVFHWCTQLCSSINTLHTAKPHIILHRDLKSLNVMVTGTYQLKLGDFGLSRAQEEPSSKTFRQIRGTAAWMPPEVIEGEEQGWYCDVYSIGIIIWEILACCMTGAYQVPYREYKFNNDFVLHRNVKKGVRPTIPTTCPTSFAKMLEEVWQHDIDRPNCAEIICKLEQIKSEWEANSKEWEYRRGGPELIPAPPKDFKISAPPKQRSEIAPDDPTKGGTAIPDHTHETPARTGESGDFEQENLILKRQIEQLKQSLLAQGNTSALEEFEKLEKQVELQKQEKPEEKNEPKEETPKETEKEETEKEGIQKEEIQKEEIPKETEKEETETQKETEKHKFNSGEEEAEPEEAEPKKKNNLSRKVAFSSQVNLIQN